jgi:hypothetical protein
VLLVYTQVNQGPLPLIVKRGAKLPALQTYTMSFWDSLEFGGFKFRGKSVGFELVDCFHYSVQDQTYEIACLDCVVLYPL